MIAATVTGVGGYLPPRVVSNKDIESLLETTDEWIQQRTGIQQRHWVTSESTSDLAFEAAKVAIKNAGIETQQIDLIILATSSPDTDIPGAAAFLQAKLELPGVPYFDIRQACSGFIYGMSLADHYIRSETYKCILLVGAEVQSKGLDRTPLGKNVSILFGDGAGAVIIQARDVESMADDSSESKILSMTLHADGAFAKELWMPAPGSAFGADRITHEMIDRGEVYPQMNGKLVFVHAVTKMPAVLMETIAKSQKNIEDVDLFFFHQANLRINQKVGEDLKISSEKIYNTIQKFGNTTAATIPLGMYDAYQAGVLKKGQLVGLAAFGAGFTWASAVLRF